MIDKYLLDELRLRNDEKGELARWVIQLQIDLDTERLMTASRDNQIAELGQRLRDKEGKPADLYLCRVTRYGEELYSPCGKDYPPGRGYYTTPPAPVVPAPCKREQIPYSDIPLVVAYAAGYNACRIDTLNVSVPAPAEPDETNKFVDQVCGHHSKLLPCKMP